MTTRAVGEEEGGFGGMRMTQAMGEQEGDMMAPLLDFARPSDITLGGYSAGGGGKAPGIENSMAVTTRAAMGFEDGGGGSPMPGFGGMMTMALGEESGGFGSLEQAPGLIGSMMTQAMGEQEGDMMPPLITDIGPPSGINNFSTMAVGEDGGGPPPMSGLLPGSNALPPSFGPTTQAMGEEDGGGGGNLLPEPFEPPSQSRTTELIEELISLLRGSRSPPNVLERRPPQVGQVGQPLPSPDVGGDPRIGYGLGGFNAPRGPNISAEELNARFLSETSNPMQQAAERPPPESLSGEVSGIGALNNLASNPLFQDFATQLQTSNPRQSALLGNLFEQGSKGLQQSQQNQFQPQNNPFMGNSSPFMAPPQFFSPQAYGQFAPPPMGFSQFQPPIPYGNAGGFAPPPPPFAPMQQGMGDSSPFANSIRSGALSTFALQ